MIVAQHGPAEVLRVMKVHEEQAPIIKLGLIALSKFVFDAGSAEACAKQGCVCACLARHIEAPVSRIKSRDLSQKRYPRRDLNPGLAGESQLCYHERRCDTLMIGVVFSFMRVSGA